MSHTPLTASGPFRLLRLLALVAALALTASACGDDTEETTTGGEDAAATDDATADDATTDDAATDDAAGDEEAATDGATAEGLPVDLGEWYIEVDGVTAGSNTFAITNSGTKPHAFAIAKGTSYEELPQLDNGAVDTDALGADYLGTTENIQPGDSDSIDFDLEAGDYVFFCPIAVGPNSHAAQGQVLSVTVG